MRIRIEMLASLTSLAATAALVAGCGGSSGTPGSAALPGASGSMTTQSVIHGAPVPSDGNGCRHSGGVQISPCVIAFNSKNPGPAIVKVDSSNHRVTEKDDCARRGVASITANLDGTYTVTAGSTAGHCEALISRVGNDRDGRGGGNGNGNGGGNGNNDNGAFLTVFNLL
jgi:hypothetical protein